MQKYRPALIALWAASVAAVVWLSLSPGSATPPVFPHQDKLLHFAAYLWLALLPMRGLTTRNAAFTGAGAMIFLGAGLEVAQAFVPLREPSLADLAINILGVTAGIRLGTHLKTRENLKQSGMNRHYHTDGSRKTPPTDKPTR